jgi:predicted acyl esterase
MGGSCGHRPNDGVHSTEGFPQIEAPHGPRTSQESTDHDFTCSRGWVHFNERAYEIRDLQEILSALVDAGVSDPTRIVVAGYSNGGIQTWMLATSEPWETAKGTKLQVAAAVPIASGTSGQNSLLPNGRATDDRVQRSLERPYGIPKLSALGVLALWGRAFPGGPMRWNDTEPSERHSYTTAWLEFWAKGEPFDTPEGKELAEILRNKGAYHADRYFAAVRAKTARAVPILAIQGWNDAIFPAVEALQMYRKLRNADPNYPVSILLTDIGHANGRDKGDLRGLDGQSTQIRDAWQKAANTFLDAYALGGGVGAPRPSVVSMSTECTQELGKLPPESKTLVSADWDSIHPSTFTLKGRATLATSWDGLKPGEEVTSDPGLLPKPEWPKEGGCIRQAAGTYDDSDAFNWEVPAGGVTLLGLPELSTDYKLSGVDATVIAKLWDVDETGRRTLVTRGLYRLALAGGDPGEGRLRFKLFGNHYRFDEGHKIQLELSQTDVPFLQPDRLASSITYSKVRIDLPTR